jgi:hypothetical protein
MIIILKHQAEDTRPNNLRMHMHSKATDHFGDCSYVHTMHRGLTYTSSSPMRQPSSDGHGLTRKPSGLIRTEYKNFLSATGPSRWYHVRTQSKYQGSCTQGWIRQSDFPTVKADGLDYQRVSICCHLRRSNSRGIATTL